MPGGTGDPYRPPCLEEWPETPKKYLGCGHHLIQAHKTIPRMVNTTSIPNDPCEPQTWGFPTPRPINELGPPPYQPGCDTGLPVGRFPDWYLNTYGAPVEGDTQTVDLSLCSSKSGFKNCFASHVWHGSHGPFSANGASRRYSMNADGTCIRYEEASARSVPDQVKYLTRTVKADRKKVIHSAGSPANVTVETRDNTCTVNRISGKMTGINTESSVDSTGPVAFSADFDDMVSSISTMTYEDITTRYFYWKALLVSGLGVTTYVDGINPKFTDVTDIGTEATDTSIGELGFGPTLAFFDLNYKREFDNGNPDYTITEHIEVTPTAVTYSFHLNQSTPTLVDTIDFTITVAYSNPYTWEMLSADVDALLATWNLGDDAQYPWRLDQQDALSKLGTPLDNGSVLVTGGPYVTYNTRAEQGPIAWPSPVDGVQWVDESMPARQDYPDGGIIGAPLDAGYESFFDFLHTDYHFEDWTTIPSIGATAGVVAQDFEYGQLSPWYHATQWLDNLTARHLPIGPFTEFSAFINPEKFNNITGKPIRLGRGLFKCKWAEILHHPMPSHNYFRPCGSDRDVLDSTPAIRWPSAWPICGRIAIVSATQNGGNVDIITEANALVTGDDVDFTGVAGLGSGLNVTVTDSTHFSVVGTLTTSPTLTGYVSSTGAPSFGWDDTGKKGDFVFKRWNYDWRDFWEAYNQRMVAAAGGCGAPPSCDPVRYNAITPTDPNGGDEIGTGSYWEKTFSCEQFCLPLTPCDPAVVYVSPNTETGHANSVTIPMPGHDGLGDSQYGSLWLGRLEQVMVDPLGLTGTYEEARCSVPTGAPALPTDPTTTQMGCPDYIDNLNADPQIPNAWQCEPPYTYTLLWDDTNTPHRYEVYGEPNTNYIKSWLLP